MLIWLPVRVLQTGKFSQAKTSSLSNNERSFILSLKLFERDKSAWKIVSPPNSESRRIH